MSHDTERVIQIFKKTICCFKNDKMTMVNFDKTTQFSKIYTVICPFCAKNITFDENEYRGIIFNGTVVSCRI